METKSYFIYKVTLSQVGYNSVYYDYFGASDITAIYDYYNNDAIRKIITIEHLGLLNWADENFFKSSEEAFSLYEFEYLGKLNSFCNTYVVAKNIQDVHIIAGVDPVKVRIINKIDSIRYIKSFKEMDAEVERMRIG